MNRRRWVARVVGPSLSVALAGSLAASLAGCGLLDRTSGDDPDDPGDTGDTAATATAAPSPDLGRAGRRLSETDLDAAFGAGPPGFYARAADPTLDETTRFRRTDPERCIDVFRGGEAARSVRQSKAGQATRSWESGERDDYRLIALRVETHDEPVGAASFDAADAAVEDCATFALTGEDLDSRWQVERLDLPSLGEQSVALRFVTFERAGDSTQRFVIDTVTVRVGHNLLYATQTASTEDPPTEELQDVVSAALDRLAR